MCLCVYFSVSSDHRTDRTTLLWGRNVPPFVCQHETKICIWMIYGLLKTIQNIWTLTLLFLNKTNTPTQRWKGRKEHFLLRAACQELQSLSKIVLVISRSRLFFPASFCKSLKHFNIHGSSREVTENNQF